MERGAKRPMAWAACGAILALVMFAGPALARQVEAEPARPTSESRALGPRRADANDVAAPGSSTREGRSGGFSLVQSTLALGGVVAVIVVLGLVVRRFSKGRGGLLGDLGPGGRAPAGVLEVLGRYPIGRGSTLVLLKLDRRVLLTCQSHGRKQSGPGMTTLCELSDPDEVASLLVKAREEEGESMARRFQSLLSREDAWIGQATGAKAGEAKPGREPTRGATVEATEANGPSDEQLSRAMALLKHRVGSFSTPRQPMASGRRAG